MMLSTFDVILVNSSGGKDSQAMLDLVCELAREQGVLERVVVVHCDLGRVEWKGTRELAEEQARSYGVRFEVVSRAQGNLLDHVRARRRWPGPATRFCTSDHKRSQVYRLLTQLAAEHRARGGGRVRILNCMGMRAQESSDRAKMVPLKLDAKASNSRREITTWLPLHDWTVAQVWERIRASGVRHHRAYDLGMPRLSCCFCIYAPRDALLLAGLHNPELLEEYVAVEQEIGHDFKHRLPIASIRTALDAGERPATVEGWSM